MTLHPRVDLRVRPRGRTTRPVRGHMNGMEARYAAHLERQRQRGEIARFDFEAVKFRLADKTWYTPDFLVMLPTGLLELHECKGWMEEDANVKLKVTAEAYWLFRVVLVKERPRGVFTLIGLDRA